MKKKFISLLLALVMILGTAMPALALSEEPAEKYSKDPTAVTQTVTLHKLLMTKDELTAWNENGPEGYDGSQNLEGLNELSGKTLKEIAGVYFRWKFADDEVNGTNKGKYVKVDAEGNVTATENAEEAYGGLTGENGIVFNTPKFKGKFVIEEVKEKSTYKGDILAEQKAVPVVITLPLVADQGTVLNAHVYPKNTEEKPKIDKDFEKEFGGSNGANAGADRNEETNNVKPTAVGVGDFVPYHVQTKFPAKSALKTVQWSDVMTKGLTFVKSGTDENHPFTVKIGETTLVKGTDYTLTENESGFTLRLEKEGLEKINGQEEEVTVDIKYFAKVNSNAVVEVPDKNDVRLEYSNNPDRFQEEEPTPVNPKDNKIIAKKTFEAGSEPKVGEKLIFDLWELDNDGNKVRVVDTKVVTIAEANKEGFVVEFTDLKDDVSYAVIERKSGYNVSYAPQESGDNQVVITNTKDNENPPPLNPEEPSVVTGGKKFVKQDATTKERLAGAKFLVKNSDGTKYLYKKSDAQKTQEYNNYKQKEADYQTAINEYNNRKDDTNKATLLKVIEDARKARDDAFKASQAVYEWKDAPADKDPDKLAETDIVILTSDNEGRFEITGLTYGSYKLEEIQAPKGYATRSDVDFTIGENSYSTADVDIKYTPTDAANNAKAVDNKKTSIPQTGGIGTIIFTVAGLAIMGTAVMSLRKKNVERA